MAERKQAPTPEEREKPLIIELPPDEAIRGLAAVPRPEDDERDKKPKAR